MNMLNKKHYKYLHIITAKDMKFVASIVRMINSPRNGFHNDEHVFVVSNKDVYDGLKEFGDNIVLDETTKNWFQVYDKTCDWFISHGFFDKKKGMAFNKRIKNKIVFRYWGGRRPLPKKQKGKTATNIFISTYSVAYKMLYKHIYGHFALIGIANIVDKIDLGDLITNVPMMKMPYSLEGRYDLARNIAKRPKKHTNYINVIIGHRSDRNERHIHYINLLQKYADKNIKIFVPLSYGDKKYAEEVKKYVINKNIKNVIIIEHFMDYSVYLNFLHEMDIALIDGETSCALGNIGIHLQFGNTLYISRTGIIKKAFDCEKVPYRCLDELENASFESFCNLIKYDTSEGKEFLSKPYTSQVKCWHEVFNYLERKGTSS